MDTIVLIGQPIVLVVVGIGILAGLGYLLLVVLPKWVFAVCMISAGVFIMWVGGVAPGAEMLIVLGVVLVIGAVIGFIDPRPWTTIISGR
jgi:hypothetical protein